MKYRILEKTEIITTTCGREFEHTRYVPQKKIIMPWWRQFVIHGFDMSWDASFERKKDAEEFIRNQISKTRTQTKVRKFEC